LPDLHFRIVMDIRELIYQNHKKLNFTGHAGLFKDKPGLINKLVELAVCNEPYPYPEYASWLLAHVTVNNINLVEPHSEKIIDAILQSNNPAILRNLVNTCSHLPYCYYREGELLDRLMAFINNEKTKPSLIVYSIYKLIQFTKKYPEIKHEIQELLELKARKNVTPAFRVAVRNFMNETGIKIIFEKQ